MAIRIECDGCGAEEALPATGDTFSPKDILLVRVEWTCTRRDTVMIDRQLCESCRIRSIEEGDPATWPRKASATR